MHLKQKQNVLYYCWLFFMWGPPALSKIWPWLLPDKGGVSCRYVGPSVRLMNGGFYLETARELQWRKECQVRNEERDLGCSLAWAEFSKHVPLSRRWTHARTYMRAQRDARRQRHQHLRVIEKLNQHRLDASRHETKQRPRRSQHTHKHTHRSD